MEAARPSLQDDCVDFVVPEKSPGSLASLEEQISLSQFQQLLSSFHSSGLHAMERTEFQQLLCSLLHCSHGNEKIALLCDKLDPEGEGVVREEELCSYILQQLQERDLWARPLPFQEPPTFRHNLYSKETLCRLMAATNPPRYITVSKDGVISTWSPSLQLQRGMALGEGGRGRGRAAWVTDCAMMTNCSKLAMATTARELLFYDLSTTVYKCQYKVYDLPSVPLCMAYYYDPESPSSPSPLLYGDESGSVVVLMFLRPLSALFPSSTKDDITIPLIPFSLLSEQGDLVSVVCLSGVHSDWVRQVQYLPGSQAILSCSSSPSPSLVIRDINRIRQPYIFRVRKGVTCFAYSQELDVLVTGSVDHEVRLWNPYVPARPVALLSRHNTAVLDVTISPLQGLVLSFSQDGVLCAWDVFEHELLQTVSVKFPFSQRQPDYGPSILSLLPTHTLTITCNEYIAQFNIGVSEGLASKFTVTSHQHPLTAALYNPHFHQVVSGCEGGVVNVWDVDSGRHMLRFPECHGQEEITAMSLDGLGRRLLTASRTGEIKVWVYGGGQCVKVMQTSRETEVTGVLHLPDKSRFLAVGWNRRISSFPDKQDIFAVKADSCWQGKDHHKDDILCVSYCPPHYLATGSFDGEIIVWNVDTEKVLSRFHSVTRIKPPALKSLRKASFGVPRSSHSSLAHPSHLTPSRPSSRRLSSYRMRCNSLHLQHVPVDQVLFLRTRVRARSRAGRSMAILVSSEAGMARFWDILGPQDPLGSFPLTVSEEESVLAMNVSPCDRTLLVGDTSGFISVFDIRDYCASPAQDDILLDPVARWRAHAGEVLSVQYVPRVSEALVLSASGDCTVRLWTLEGHYIGTFGQEQPWDLHTPSTFQHPRTPWGEMQRPPSSLSALDHRESSTSRPESRRAHQRPAPTIEVVPEEEEEGEGEGERPERPEGESTLGLSTLEQHRLSVDGLAPALTDKSVLGEPYQEGVLRRMAGRQVRRVHFAGVDLKSTERVGSLCSPYQALYLLKMDDVPVPKELPTALQHPKS